jgi:hypothetical protein
MKYISSRDNYLKQVNERRQIQVQNNLEKKLGDLILETYPGSGAMGNEVTWGDSLVGRLVNAIFRKAAIGANILMMKPLISRLRSEFEYILDSSGLVEMDVDDKKQLNLLTIYAFLNRLELNVAHLHDFKKFVGRIDPVNLTSLKDLLDATIEKVESTEPVEKKNELLRQLNDFKEFLSKLDPKDFEKEETLEDKQKNKLFTFCLDNLKSVLSIVKIYDEMQKKKFYFYAAVKGSPAAGSARELSATSADDVVSKHGHDRGSSSAIKDQRLQNAKLIDDIYKEKLAKWVEEQKKAGKNTNAGEGTRSRLRKEAESKAAEKKPIDVSAKNKEELAKVTAPVNPTAKRESLYIWEEVDYKAEEAPEKVGTGDTIEWDFSVKTKGTHVNKGIKPLYSLFKSEPGSIEELEKYFTNPEGDKKKKSPIQKIYELVRDENFRQKYAIKENLDNLLTRPENIAQKIVALYSITQKNDVMNAAAEEIKKMFSANENLVLWEKMKKELINFNATMRAVLNPELQFGKPEEKEGQKEGEAKESLLLTNYDNFIKLIREKEGDVPTGQEVAGEAGGQEVAGEAGDDIPTTATEPKEVMPKKLADKIQDWWSKNMDLNAWVVKESEVEKIKTNLEKKFAEKKDSIVIDGIDPILNIVRIFNRAYNLHTNNTIPGARTGGKVSRGVYNEYIPFGRSGGGEPNAQTEGPYRHKKTFAIWNDAVLKIMGERKFQPIFNKNTEIRVGNVNKRGAGVALRKFITEMLDGEEPYKKGSQAKMLDRYFGDMSDDDFKKLGEKDLSWKNPTTGTTDVEEAGAKSEKIKESVYKFVLPEKIKGGPDAEAGEGDDFIKEENFSGKILQISGIDDKNAQKSYYLFFQEQVGDNYYVAYSSSFLMIKAYISKVYDSEAIKVEKGDGEIFSEIRKPVLGTIMSKQTLLSRLLQNKLGIEFNSIPSNDQFDKVDGKKFIVQKVFWLVKETKESGETEGEEKISLKAVDLNDDVAKLKIGIKNYDGFLDIKATLDKDKPTTIKKD